MPIDYAAIARAGGIGKGTPIAVAKQERERERFRLDVQESAKVRKRSGGRCEIVTDGQRCVKPAHHVHHMIPGSGRRGRGESALAIRKQHACADCHGKITGREIQRLGSAVPHWQDRYRKVA